MRNNPADAEKFIEKIAKEDDFHLETMTTAKNSRSLSDDPALKDLRELSRSGSRRRLRRRRNSPPR